MCGGGRRSLLVRSHTVSSFILPMLLSAPPQAKDSESSGVLLWRVLRGTAGVTCSALRQVPCALSRLKRCWLTVPVYSSPSDGSRDKVSTVRMCRTACQDPSLHCVVTLVLPLHFVSDDDALVCCLRLARRTLEPPSCDEVLACFSDVTRRTRKELYMPGMARIAHGTTGMRACSSMSYKDKGLMKNDFVEIAKIIVLEAVKVMNEIICLCQGADPGKLRRELTELLGGLLCVKE